MLLPMILISGAMTLVLGMLYAAFTAPAGAKQRNRRLEAVKARHSGTAETLAQSQMKRILATRSDTALDSWVMRLLPRPDVLRRRLEQTGRDWTVGKYGMVCGGLGLAVFLLLTIQGAPLWLSLPAALVVGVFLPGKIVSILIARRIAQFTARFPDAIELLVRGLRSGLPISETLGVVGSEVPEPVGGEFRGVADRIKIGRTMDAALQETADRIGTPEFQFFCITLAIQRETGGNLAETLSNLAEVLRKRGQMRLKIRAMSSESKASAYIVGSLPFFVFTLIWIINGKYMQNFFVDPRLMIAGGIGLVWMTIGGFIMAKMVSFEI